MDRTITTYGTLYSLVEDDTKVHKVKELAELFLSAMLDWPTTPDTISDFVRELKNYFGSPLTVKNLKSRKLNLWEKHNPWRLESRCSIVEMIEMSTQFCNESDFDKILENILTYYEETIS